MKTRFPAVIATFIWCIGAQNAFGGGPQIAEDEYIGGSVARSTFTSAVVKREPIDHITTVDSNRPFAYFFTELKGMAGQTVTHRWEHNGETIAEQQFKVGAPKWRVWSLRVLPPQRLGQWTVSVVNALDEVVHRSRLDYVTTLSAK